MVVLVEIKEEDMSENISYHTFLQIDQDCFVWCFVRNGERVIMGIYSSLKEAKNAFNNLKYVFE